MNEWLEYQLGNALKAKKSEKVPKSGIPQDKEARKLAARQGSDLNGQGRIGKWEGDVLNKDD
jgi:hypothetical protein